MAITDRNQAKEGGFAQVREALVAFEGDVVEQDARGNKTEIGEYGAGTWPDGKPKPKKEFLQVVCVNVVPLEVKEELVMDISEGWTFRINCSDYKGSFWIDTFLEAADKNKIQIPEGMVNKRIQFRLKTFESKDSKGNAKPEYNVTNFVIDKVVDQGEESTAPKVVSKPVQAPKPAPTTSNVVQPTPAEEVVEEEPAQEQGTTSTDPMDIAMEVAVGKTEQQFRSAIALHPAFVGSPLLSLAKAGAVTQTLITNKKLKLVQEGTKQVYRKA